jgi:hypothetical protein
MAVALAAFSLTSWGQTVEYFWDTDPGVGNGQVLQTFTGNTAALQTEIDAGSLSVGIHRLGLRVLNGEHYSATYYRQFYVPAAAEHITRIEYSWDKALAMGEGTPLNFTEGKTIDLTTNLSTTGLTEGIHTLYIRTLSTNHYSQTYSRQFYVRATPHSVEAIEYFFDEDPGVGNAIQKTASIAGDQLDLAFDVDTEGLTDGIHHIGLRTLTDGTWSSTYYRQFLVRSVEENQIARLEYFWNDDPGAGNGYVVDITPGKEVTVDFEADMSDLPEGMQTLGLRAQSSAGGWSPATLVKDIEFEGWDALQNYLNSLIDTEDVLTANTYEREFRNKHWHALYVPFSLSYYDWSAHFDVARINAFYQYDDDEDGVVDRQVLEAIIIRPGNGNLKPNHPYLIRAKVPDSYTFNFNPSTVVPQEINSVSCSTMEACYTFTGNYSDMTGLKTANRYRLQGGTLSVPSSDNEVLPPFRWYLTIDDLGNQLDPAAARIHIRVVGDDATPVDDALFADDDLIGQRKVYDLSGRRVDVSPETPLRSLPKGIYIINNKKYIVK